MEFQKKRLKFWGQLVYLRKGKPDGEHFKLSYKRNPCIIGR